MRFISTINSAPRLISKAQLTKEITQLSKKHDCSLFYLFGSYNTSKISYLSDIDVAILPGKKTKILSLLGDIQELFQFDAIDLIDLKTANPELSHRIIRDGTCLYSKDILLKINFETQREQMYYELQPLREEYFKHLQRRLQSQIIKKKKRMVIL